MILWFCCYFEPQKQNSIFNLCAFGGNKLSDLQSSCTKVSHRYCKTKGCSRLFPPASCFSNLNWFTLLRKVAWDSHVKDAVKSWWTNGYLYMICVWKRICLSNFSNATPQQNPGRLAISSWTSTARPGCSSSLDGQISRVHPAARKKLKAMSNKNIPFTEKNPAPVDRYCIPLYYRVFYIPGGARFLPSTVPLSESLDI